MDYEILVINEEMEGRTAKRGQLVTAYPKGHLWKKREKESRFAIIPYVGKTEELTEVMNKGYKYDFTQQKFIHKVTNDEFDKNLVLDKTDAPIHSQIIEDVATELDPNWKSKEPDVCKFLHPKHLPYQEDGTFRKTRIYWFNKFRKFKQLSGVREFLAAILFRDYGNIANAGKNLPQATKDAVFQSVLFTKDDKDWMKWTWRENG